MEGGKKKRLFYDIFNGFELTFGPSGLVPAVGRNGEQKKNI